METLYCLGAQGTFSHQAAIALKRAGEAIDYADHLVAVIDKVTLEDAQGIVPIENSTTGLIRPVLDAIAASELVISDAYSLKVAHHLVSKKSDAAKQGSVISMADVACIYAQREAFDQCTAVLGPLSSRIVLTHSSHLALKSLLSHKDSVALALVTDQQLESPELQVFQKHVENAAHNQTRFVRIQKGHYHEFESGVMLVGFSLNHRVGALAGALNFLANHGANLRAIHSRPIENSLGHYRFFIEIGIESSSMANHLNRGYHRYLRDVKFMGCLRG